MPMSFLHCADLALSTVLTVLTLRGFPILVRFSAAPSCRPLHRIIAIVGYTVVGTAAVWRANYDAVTMMLCYAYMAAATCVAYGVGERLRSRAGTFAVCVLLFMAVPALVPPSVRVISLILGWDFMLASYSYGVSGPAPRSLEQCAGFVLLNPTLVHGRRGKDGGRVALHVGGLLRISQGAGSMFFSELARLLVEGTPVRTTALLYGCISLIQIYASHTGLASIQIGLCRQIGMTLPERYAHPLGASSPKEFWARWNTYVGSWIRTYVYQPLALYGRRRLRFGGPFSSVLSVLVSFAAVGALHDLYTSLSFHELRYAATVWFIVNGLILLAWEAMASMIRRRRVPRPWFGVAARGLVVMIAVAMTLAI